LILEQLFLTVQFGICILISILTVSFGSAVKELESN